jgi:hypothetical protein
LFGEKIFPPQLSLLAGVVVVGALLASPSAIPGTRKAALAALAPGLCRASSSGRLDFKAAHRSDPAFLLAQRLGPRRGFSPLKAGAPSQGLLALARGAAALPKAPEGSGWTAVIELRPVPPKPRKQALTTKPRTY